MNREHPCGTELMLEVVRQRLREYAEPKVVLPAERVLRAAAVLIPLVCAQGQWHLLYTRRTDRVASHKGQVSFPGGAAENEDPDRIATALRETQEEIGIARTSIEVLGQLWEMPTITGFSIRPVVGTIPWPVDLTLSPDEVSRAFIVPLKWLADPANREEMDLNLPDGRRERVVYYQLFDQEKIWGATARITLHFLRVIGWV